MEGASLKKNFFMNALLTVSSIVFPLISFQYVSRVLQPAGVGKVSFAQSFVIYFNMVAKLGIPTYGIRACARVRDDRERLSKTARELLTINLVMAVLSYALLFLTVIFVPRFQEDRWLYILMSLEILLEAVGMEWLYKGLEKYGYITVRSMIFKAVALVILFFAVRSTGDHMKYGAVLLLSGYGSFILNFIYSRKYVDLGGKWTLEISPHIKPVLIFFAMSCATTVYTNLDTVMLGFMTNDTEVGYYHVAVKAKTVLVALITSLGAVVLPRASYLVENGMMDDFRKMCIKATRFVAVSALPLMVYFMLFAKEGISLLSGSGYYPAIMPMRIIMPTLVFIGLTNVMGVQILLPTGREKTVFYSVAAGAVADLIINLMLIPTMGASGASAGTLVAEVIVLIIQTWALRKEIPGMLPGAGVLKVLPAIALATAGSFWILNSDWHYVIRFFLSAFLFFGIYALSLLALKEELVLEVWEGVCDRMKRILSH